MAYLVRENSVDNNSAIHAKEALNLLEYLPSWEGTYKEWSDHKNQIISRNAKIKCKFQDKDAFSPNFKAFDSIGHAHGLPNNKPDLKLGLAYRHIGL